MSTREKTGHAPPARDSVVLVLTHASDVDTIAWRSARPATAAAAAGVMAVVGAVSVCCTQWLPWDMILLAWLLLVLHSGLIVTLLFGDQAVHVRDHEICHETRLGGRCLWRRRFTREDIAGLGYISVSVGEEMLERTCLVRFYDKAFVVARWMNQPDNRELYYLLKTCWQKRAWPAQFWDPQPQTKTDLRFSLQTLFIVVTAIAVVLGVGVGIYRLTGSH